MDIFASKDQELQRLERRLNELEKTIKRDLGRFEESFEYFRVVAEGLRKEQVELRRDRDFLLGKYKNYLRKTDMPLAPEIFGKVKDSVKETSSLIRDVVLEELDVEPKSRSTGDLFELVMKKRKISTRAAAKELGIREDTVKYMALKLQKHGSIRISQSNGRTDLAKA